MLICVLGTFFRCDFACSDGMVFVRGSPWLLTESASPKINKVAFLKLNSPSISRNRKTSMNDFAKIGMICFAFHLTSLTVSAQFGNRDVQVLQGRIAGKNVEVNTFCEARLEAHFEAFAFWVDRCCALSENQKLELGAITHEAISNSLLAHRKLVGVNQRIFRSYYLPLYFYSSKGGAGTIFEAGLEDDLLEILNEDQKKKWQIANTERKQHNHEIFFKRVMNIANSSKLLSVKHQKKLAGLFPSKLPWLNNALYSFRPNTRHAPEKSIFRLLMHPSLSFTNAELIGLKELKFFHKYQGGKVAPGLHLQAFDGVEGWRKKINEQGELEQQKLQYTLNAASASAFDGIQLTPQEKRLLDLAGKGVAVKTVAQWKKTARQQTVAYETYLIKWPGRNISFVLEIPFNSKIEQHPLWLNAMKKVTRSINGRRRGTASKETIEYAVAILDQELWLTPEQRVKVIGFYQNIHFTDQKNYRGPQYELYLLESAVRVSGPNKLDKILSKGQLSALKKLETLFLKFNCGVL